MARLTDDQIEKSGSTGHIIQIEGIPGSGKTTAAKQLHRQLSENGINAYWVLEETQQHPITPQSLRRQSHRGNFAALSLNAWQRFNFDHQQAKQAPCAILEGYAFQSTVRFLFANNLPRSEIDAYFSTWQRIGQTRTSLIYLEIDDPDKHFHDFVIPHRGDDWTQKVTRYVETTAYAKSNKLSGTQGLISFWSHYQTLCIELLKQCTLPLQINKQSITDSTMVLDRPRW